MVASQRKLLPTDDEGGAPALHRILPTLDKSHSRGTPTLAIPDYKAGPDDGACPRSPARARRAGAQSPRPRPRHAGFVFPRGVAFAGGRRGPLGVQRREAVRNLRASVRRGRAARGEPTATRDAS